MIPCRRGALKSDFTHSPLIERHPLSQGDPADADTTQNRNAQLKFSQENTMTLKRLVAGLAHAVALSCLSIGLAHAQCKACSDLGQPRPSALPLGRG